jgi:hypothetical protein
MASNFNTSDKELLINILLFIESLFCKDYTSINPQKSLINSYNTFKLNEYYNLFKDKTNQSGTFEDFKLNISKVNEQLKLTENQCWRLFTIDLLEEVFNYKKIVNQDENKKILISSLIASLYFKLIYSSKMQKIISLKHQFENFETNYIDKYLKFNYSKLNIVHSNLLIKNQIEVLESLFSSQLKKYRTYGHNEITLRKFNDPKNDPIANSNTLRGRPMCCEANMYNFLNLLLYDFTTQEINVNFLPDITLSKNNKIKVFYSKIKDVNKILDLKVTEEFFSIFDDLPLRYIASKDNRYDPNGHDRDYGDYYTWTAYRY